ncbi:MAG: proton-conducting transporter membrane subunit [Acidithiobacillus sp.]|nr:proton-conducting transporter membrane subunit [Acidithiobacillus sp.]
MDTLAIVIPFVPVLSAAIIFLFLRNRKGTAARLSVLATLLTFLLSLSLLGDYITSQVARVEWIGQIWGSIWLDPLALIMWTFVSGISLLVHMYSVRYMVEEPNYPRFFALLDLMTATIFFMVSAADLITLLVAWFLVGVFLYFLLGHDTDRSASGRYAFWTQITYRFGDLPLWLAAFILFKAYHSLSLPVIFAQVAAAPNAVQLWGMPVPAWVGILIAISAFARSAQFLLHGWLPYTMDGPTPVSALMHAGIVNAGGFLFNRFAPIFEYTSLALHIAFVVGLITAVLGSALMLIQNDIKRSLGYSTMGQMGFMVMECGLGAFPLAVFHLIAHGFFKASLFLGAGNAIGEARAADGVPPDPVYVSVVERRPNKPSRLPLITAAALTILVPVLVLSLSHFFVASHLFFEQGVIILLFFAWVTGAQALFATHKMTHSNPWQVMGGILGSFVLVVIGYTLISHYFGNFLYPEHGASKRLFASASIGVLSYDVLVIILALLFVGGWALTFFADARDWGQHLSEKWHGTYVALYALLTRELYLNDFFVRMTQVLFAASRRLNVWFRWS